MVLNDKSIRIKIASGFGAVLFLFILVCLFGFSSFRKIQNQYQSEVLEAESFKQKLSELQIHFLMIRQWEKDFIATKNLVLIDSIQIRVSKIQKINELLMQKQNKDEKNVNLDLIKNDFSHYWNISNQLVSSIKTRGLDEDTGIRGFFRNAAHDFEAGIEQLSLERGEVLYLLCRRHEKDYVIRGKNKYIERNQATIDQLRNYLDTRRISNDQKQRYLNLLTTYANGFLKMVEIDNTINHQIQELQVLSDHILQNLALVYHNQQVIVEAYENELIQITQNTIYLFGSICVIVLILSILISMGLSKMIVKPMTDILKVMRDIAQGEGDLTVRFRRMSKDELGQLAHWFNAFLDKIHDLIVQVKSLTNRVIETSCDLNQNSKWLVTGAQSQSSNTEMITSHIDQMTERIRQSNFYVDETAHITEIATRQTEQGKQAQQEADSGMQSILDTSEQANTLIHSLVQRTGTIGEVIQVIDDISEQTNLLALNAAIEAARAGEQGRGFAVVADEVRKLAEKTHKAAIEIVSTIKAIQTDTEKVAKSMKATESAVKHGKSANQKMDASLEQIDTFIHQAKEKMQHIITNMQSQDESAKDISERIKTIDDLAGESLQVVSSLSETTETMLEQTESLQNFLGNFKVKEV